MRLERGGLRIHTAASAAAHTSDRGERSAGGDHEVEILGVGASSLEKVQVRGWG